MHHSSTKETRTCISSQFKLFCLYCQLFRRIVGDGGKGKRELTRGGCGEQGASLTGDKCPSSQSRTRAGALPPAVLPGRLMDREGGRDMPQKNNNTEPRAPGGEIQPRISRMLFSGPRLTSGRPGGPARWPNAFSK